MQRRPGRAAEKAQRKYEAHARGRVERQAQRDRLPPARAANAAERQRPGELGHQPHDDDQRRRQPARQQNAGVEAQAQNEKEQHHEHTACGAEMARPQPGPGAAPAQQCAGQQGREQSRPVEHAGEREGEHNEADEHQRAALVAEVEMPLHPVHRPGQQRRRQHRAAEQVQQMQRRGGRALRAVGVHHAQQQAADQQGVKRVERREQQQALGHLPVGAKLAADAQHYCGRGGHEQPSHDGRLQRGEAEEHQSDPHRAKAQRRFKQAHAQQGWVGAKPAQIHPVADLEEQHGQGRIDNGAGAVLQLIHIEPGSACGQNHARCGIAHQPRPLEKAKHRFPRERGQHQRGTHPEHPVRMQGPCGQVAVDHRAGSPVCEMGRRRCLG